LGLTVIDTSLVIAYADTSDSLHEAAHKAIRQAGSADELAISLITYAEILVGVFRRGGGSAEAVERFLADTGLRLQPVTQVVAALAARLRAKHAALRSPDAMILATAEVLGGPQPAYRGRQVEAIQPPSKVVPA
jgi:predicted nucleic acid-binding protein